MNNICPKCKSENQIKQGFTIAKSQRYFCKDCGNKYTPQKKHYSEEDRTLAIKTYYSGTSGYGVGKIFGMSHQNVFRWIKKTESVWISPKTKFDAFELDEIFWFIKQRRSHENGVNTYVMTMISREPRQIVGFAVDNSKSADIIQKIVDSVPPAKRYYTDGYYGYSGVDFCGQLKQNWLNKNDTHLIESTNADLRHYISGLHRRSRIFYRTLETFRAVLSVFIDAYNKFGEYKMKYKKRTISRSVLDFL